MMKPMRTLAIAVEEIPSCDFRKTGSVSRQIVAITRMHKNLCKFIGGLRVADHWPHKAGRKPEKKKTLFTSRINSLYG